MLQVVGYKLTKEETPLALYSD